MNEFTFLLTVLAIFLLCLLGPRRSEFKPNRYCKDDPSKECPYTLYVTHNGGVGVKSGLVECCVFRKGLEACGKLKQEALENE